MQIMDRLYEEVAKKGPVCVGLDTDPSYIPMEELAKSATAEKAVLEYNHKMIDATLDIAAAYKVQIAYYEAMGIQGLEIYRDTLKYIREKKAIVITDVKRGDIAKTAEMYAKAHFTGDFEADIITLNPWMGIDTLHPYYSYLERNDKGIFVLLSTSNPGAHDLEYQVTQDGRPMWQVLGERLSQEGKRFIGDHGYSAIGAVVGCTRPEDAAEIRKLFPELYFLVPGYGAQGGGAKELEKAFDGEKNGAVVNASRSILLAYKQEQYSGLKPEEAARKEALAMQAAFK